MNIQSLEAFYKNSTEIIDEDGNLTNFGKESKRYYEYLTGNNCAFKVLLDNVTYKG